MKSKTLLPKRANPMEGKDMAALEGVASAAPVQLRQEPPLQQGRPVVNTTVGETQRDTMNRSAIHRDTPRYKSEDEQKGVLSPQRLPLSLIDAISYLKDVDDRSAAWVIQHYAGEVIKQAARERGWGG